MPGRHPDDDLLADLAADVLPVEQARAVESHVMSCERCAALLSDAERVRGLLLADDAGPVPPEIWSRIEAALRSAALSSPGGQPGANSPPSPPAPRRVDADARGGWDGADPLDDPDDWATTPRPKISAHPTPASEPMTGRVRALPTSRRENRPDRRFRGGPLLVGAAAAIVLLLAVGTGRLIQSARGGAAAAFGSSGTASSADSAAGGNPTGALIVRSNADYTSATLAQGARTLISRATSGQAEGHTTKSGSATRSAQEAPRAVPYASVPANSQAQDVTNPQRLAACLTALNASSAAVVAVDLARYQEREAAILVLRTESGYEVWVVERTCHAGDEGALKEITLPG